MSIREALIRVIDEMKSQAAAESSDAEAQAYAALLWQWADRLESILRQIPAGRR